MATSARTILAKPANWERRALQVAVALAGLVPITAGFAGMQAGSAMIDAAPPPGSLAQLSLDSHVRYLSGLLFGIGLVFWASIPWIETATPTFRLLTGIVVIGGLARLIGLIVMGTPSSPMLFGLCMELVITPLLCLWQARVAGMRGALPLALPTRA